MTAHTSKTDHHNKSISHPPLPFVPDVYGPSEITTSQRVSNRSDFTARDTR